MLKTAQRHREKGQLGTGRRRTEEEHVGNLQDELPAEELAERAPYEDADRVGEYEDGQRHALEHRTGLYIHVR